MNIFAEPRGEPLRYQAVHKLVGRLRERTGITFNLHALRHSLATDLLRKGVPLEVVSKVLTHRSVATTLGTYSHLGVEDLRAVPLSAKAVAAVRAQQRLVEETWPEGSPWLFPSPFDPETPMAYYTFLKVFSDWQVLVGLHDEAGQPVHAAPHQLRHSLGTRLINSGLPQPVVQRLLGHGSPAMTDVYAQILDSTLREQLQRYWATRVDFEGRLLGFDPSSPTADAEWLKYNLARVAGSLPTGYCGRPLSKIVLTRTPA